MSDAPESPPSKEGTSASNENKICSISMENESPGKNETGQNRNSVRFREYFPSTYSLRDTSPAREHGPGGRVRSKSDVCADEKLKKSIVSSITLSKPRWSLSIDFFKIRKRGQRKEDKELPRRVREFYQRQDELIDLFEEDIKEFGQLDTSTGGDQSPADKRAQDTARAVDRLAKLTFFVNIALVGGKLSAAIATLSLSIISSLVDSFMDVLSGAIIWFASRAIRKRDWYKYPQGRRKLEPVAVLCLSVVMSVASLQVMQEAVRKIIDVPEKLTFDLISTCIVCVTIVAKLVLYLLCRRHNTPIINALAADHRNDVLSNSVALFGALLGTYIWEYADPIGAILISIYIIINWSMMSREQIKNLTGHTANPRFLKRITWLCLNHDKRIVAIDTVRAFHFGTSYLVEVDIVLPKEMSLGEAHDIGEPLQQKLERFPDVERAFVHLDYNYEHDPEDEHIHR